MNRPDAINIPIPPGMVKIISILPGPSPLPPIVMKRNLNDANNYVATFSHEGLDSIIAKCLMGILEAGGIEHNVLRDPSHKSEGRIVHGNKPTEYFSEGYVCRIEVNGAENVDKLIALSQSEEKETGAAGLIGNKKGKGIGK